MSATTAFRRRVAAGLANLPVLRAVREATLRKVEQRAAGMAQLRDPEALRDLAARIRQHTLDHLPDYLEHFAANLTRSGGRLHFAPDAAAAGRIVCRIARDCGARLAVKAKSMTSEEVHLNEALESAGVRVVETDLGEFIVQLDRDRPSHIVTPIIHKNRRQIAATMQRELGCRYTEDPRELTGIARAYLRDIFRRCDLGITGVNFAVAETGTICICTNEGNGRMTMTRPRVHVALMGIEKLIPRMTDLPVFLKLLARSSTGQSLTVYTTLITGPRRDGESDGPRELHVVLLDNGRSALLGGPLAEVLRCIRCGACLNACPVYRNIGGHAYGGVYPGPIGSLLTPLLFGLRQHAELPRASSLCGACLAACPVRIDIPGLLVRLRAETAAAQPPVKRLGLALWRYVMMSPRLYSWAQRALRLLPRDEEGRITTGPGPLAAWTRVRDLPAPSNTFRERWQTELCDER
jgi:L-lactate dehydrogenase complex protein LldF